MQKSNSSKINTVKTSKIAIADDALNEKVLKLIELASGAPKQNFIQAKSSAKLFELVVLADILEVYTTQFGAGTAKVKNNTGNILKIAGSPASANKSRFSYFELCDKSGKVSHEIWVSVEVLTLSWNIMAFPPLSPIPRSGKHEIDVGIFEPLPALSKVKHAPYPPHTSLHAGFSCKHFQPVKESVREALGIRRETAFLNVSKFKHQSMVPWLISYVPTKPSSPLFLVSSTAGVYSYQTPVDRMGVYMMAVPFSE